MRIESGPDLPRVARRRERVEQDDLAAGLDAGRVDNRPPAESGPPIRILDSPEPQTRRHIEKRLRHARDMMRPPTRNHAIDPFGARRNSASPGGPSVTKRRSGA